MKGAIPLSARSNTSGWQRRERKQNASIEQRLAKRGGGTEADEIQAALRLICLLLSLKQSLIKEWRGLFAASYVLLLPGCQYFCLVCQRSGAASLLGQVLLRWIWKQINQAISGSRHFSLTLRGCLRLHRFHVSLHFCRIHLTWNKLKNPAKRYSPALCGPYSAVLLHCFFCSLLLLLIFISFSLPCFWAWQSMTFYLQKSINQQELISNCTLREAIYCADIVSSCSMIGIFFRNTGLESLCGLAATKGCVTNFLLRTIYSVCVAQDQMTHGPIPVRGPGVGDCWLKDINPNKLQNIIAQLGLWSTSRFYCPIIYYTFLSSWFNVGTNRTASHQIFTDVLLSVHEYVNNMYQKKHVRTACNVDDDNRPQVCPLPPLSKTSHTPECCWQSAAWHCAAAELSTAVCCPLPPISPSFLPTQHGNDTPLPGHLFKTLLSQFQVLQQTVK